MANREAQVSVGVDDPIVGVSLAQCREAGLLFGLWQREVPRHLEPKLLQINPMRIVRRPAPNTTRLPGTSSLPLPAPRSRWSSLTASDSSQPWGRSSSRSVSSSGGRRQRSAVNPADEERTDGKPSRSGSTTCRRPELVLLRHEHRPLLGVRCPGLGVRWVAG